MYKLVEKRIRRLYTGEETNILDGRRIGVEKESLRVSPDGTIAQTPHPPALGAALTNPYLTTDYSEALLEFITPPLAHTHEVLDFLRDAHSFVYQHLQDEILWATSMPCVIAGDDRIPIARYGSSNMGMMKHVYRKGLAQRYGRVMQVIAGVHFNYSLPDEFWRYYQDMEEDRRDLQSFINDQYFGLIRNLQRFGWLIPYLFGASPAVCKSFIGGSQSTLDEFDVNTYYEPYATSLRMGDIGYQNNKENESGVKACYRNVDAYVESLQFAINTPSKEYEAMGIKVGDEYRQLNANLLQIENEYYSTVRPKQPLRGNEKPTRALSERGVKYIELRSLDVNAFHPLGISQVQLRFIEALMIFCLLHDSEQICMNEQVEIDQNELDVAHRGRDPSLTLHRNARQTPLKDWALEIMDVLQLICECLDQNLPHKPYQEALQTQIDKVHDPDLTPSARMLKIMRENGEGFYHFARRMSQKHYDYFRSIELNGERKQFFERVASESLEKQQQIEASDTQSFDDYLQAYFQQ